MCNQRFPPSCRIRSSLDFKRIYQRRCAASDELLLIFSDRNDLPYPRLGLSVSRKIGGAVERNRWKRLLREAFRLNRRQLPRGIDLVVVVRKRAAPSLDAIGESLIKLSGRLAGKLS
jgi:ribonuclease P protein component